MVEERIETCITFGSVTWKESAGSPQGTHIQWTLNNVQQTGCATLPGATSWNIRVLSISVITKDGTVHTDVTVLKDLANERNLTTAAGTYSGNFRVNSLTFDDGCGIPLQGSSWDNPIVHVTMKYVVEVRDEAGLLLKTVPEAKTTVSPANCIPQWTVTTGGFYTAEIPVQPQRSKPDCEPTQTPTPTEKPKPNEKPTPTDKPTEQPKPTDKPKPTDPKTDPKKPSRGVPAETGGGEEGLTSLAVLGGIGLAVSGAVLAASRREE
ncbi:MAG: hypothetical protein Q4G35_05465 [Propionibacteriaceae bacterium]|nr:hypothetical protein [Propionibacteriaceae bacterium]